MRFDPRYALIACIVFLMEVVIATQLHAWPWIRGSLGDVLVVVLMYFALLTLWRVRPLPLALGVFAFACGVELAQLMRINDLLGVPRDSMLGIMIGNTASWSDVAMYAIGAALAWLLHTRVWRERA